MFSVSSLATDCMSLVLKTGKTVIRCYLRHRLLTAVLADVLAHPREDHGLINIIIYIFQIHYTSLWHSVNFT